ncbi:hypothetical protein AVEN_25708-1 [Araneus ventricosus]|uniref:Uncharacterized protein n=1 Tax=Araneus ventricosus TaxID=182803 RepID=A0A4Y2TWP6_ARAVE|nr:hypothetical protein AVEN_25708-1 [Araneus ventricosus]
MCWLPLNVFYLLHEFNANYNQYTLTTDFLFATGWVMSSEGYNPSIYCCWNEHFSREPQAASTGVRNLGKKTNPPSEGFQKVTMM